MGRTPQKVVELLHAEIPAKISRNKFCIQTGINQNSIDKYMAGITEPTQASLEKLGAYFKKPVAWFRLQDRKFSEEDWDYSEDSFNDDKKILKDLIKIHALVPEHLKKTMIFLIKLYGRTVTEISSTYYNDLNDNENKEIEKILDQANQIVGDFYAA